MGNKATMKPYADVEKIEDLETLQGVLDKEYNYFEGREFVAYIGRQYVRFICHLGMDDKLKRDIWLFVSMSRGDFNDKYAHRSRLPLRAVIEELAKLAREDKILVKNSTIHWKQEEARKELHGRS
jgi:hypothetical protein